MKNKIFIALALIGPAIANATAPVDVCANVGAPFHSVTQMINYVSCTLVKAVVPLLFTLATVAFIWGIIKYFLNPDNEESRQQGKGYMIWGIIALFVMVSMWGLVGVLSSTFGVRVFIPQLSN